MAVSGKNNSKLKVIQGLKISEEFDNSSTALIHVNADKAELILTKYEQAIKFKQSWIAPFGVFVSLFLTDLTVTFNKEFLGIGENVIKAFFMLSTLLSFAWAVYAGYKSFKAKNITPAELVNILSGKSK